MLQSSGCGVSNLSTIQCRMFGVDLANRGGYSTLEIADRGRLDVADLVCTTIIALTYLTLSCIIEKSAK